MLDYVFETVLPVVISILELMGIFVVSISATRGFIEYLQEVFLHKKFNLKYELANGLATALQFKMAAEIIKTALVHDLTELTTLGLVIVLRALMSVLIHFEMRSESKTHA